MFNFVLVCTGSVITSLFALRMRKQVEIKVETFFSDDAVQIKKSQSWLPKFRTDNINRRTIVTRIKVKHLLNVIQG